MKKGLFFGMILLSSLAYGKEMMPKPDVINEGKWLVTPKFGGELATKYNWEGTGTTMKTTIGTIDPHDPPTAETVGDQLWIINPIGYQVEDKLRDQFKGKSDGVGGGWEAMLELTRRTKYGFEIGLGTGYQVHKRAAYNPIATRMSGSGMTEGVYMGSSNGELQNGWVSALAAWIPPSNIAVILGGAENQVEQILTDLGLDPNIIQSWLDIMPSLSGIGGDIRLLNSGGSIGSMNFNAEGDFFTMGYDSIPVYGTLKYTLPTKFGFNPYIKGNLGWSFNLLDAQQEFDSKSDADVIAGSYKHTNIDFNSADGLYWAAGIGAEYNSLTIDLMYQMNQAKMIYSREDSVISEAGTYLFTNDGDTPTLDIAQPGETIISTEQKGEYNPLDYGRVTLSIGYQFQF